MCQHCSGWSKAVILSVPEELGTQPSSAGAASALRAEPSYPSVVLE